MLLVIKRKKSVVQLLCRMTVCLLLLVGASDARADDTVKAMEKISSLHNYLLVMMKGDEGASFERRYLFLSPKIERIFHIPSMATSVSGRYGLKASDEDREKFEEVFLGFMTANYVMNFKSFNGESFETLDAELVRSGKAMRVKSVLTTKDKKVRLDYIMVAKGFGWQIVDILLDGKASEVTRRASEFRKILRATGLEGLTIALREKALSMQSQF